MSRLRNIWEEPPDSGITGRVQELVTTLKDWKLDEIATLGRLVFGHAPEWGALVRTGTPIEEVVKPNDFRYARLPQYVSLMEGFKYPLYDTLVVPASGEVNECVFIDHLKFPDGTPKRQSDTNLTQNSQLGHPLEYDLSWFELRFEEWEHPEDVRRVLAHMMFTWIFGGDTAFLRTSGSGFTPVPFAGTHAAKVIDGELRDKAIKEGVWPILMHRFESPDGKPRQIQSTESFRAKLEINAGKLEGAVRLKVFMQDTLYRPGMSRSFTL